MKEKLTREDLELIRIVRYNLYGEEKQNGKEKKNTI